jgi:hypothetical protein
MARQLLDIDVDRVGFVAWLGERGPHGESKLTGLKRFCAQRLGVSETLMPRAIDRLGKWVGYLICFDVVQETSGPPAYWCVSTRHVSALHKVTAATDNAAGVLTRDQERDALLGAYSSASQQLGTKLYVPIHNLRESLGLELALPEAPLLNSQLDDILRRAPALLDDYTVTFSPFSGPARGGLEIPGMYAGYMSVRLRAPAPRKAPRGRKDG